MVFASLGDAAGRRMGVFPGWSPPTWRLRRLGWPVVSTLRRLSGLGFLAWLGTAAVAAWAQSAPGMRILDLQEAERLLLAQGRDIVLARRLAQGAAADTERASARPNPTLSWNAQSISPASGVGGGAFLDKRIDQVLRLEQTLERGDKRRLRTDAAQALAQGARADEAEQRRQGLAAARSAYYDLMLAEQRLAVYEQTDASYSLSLAAAERRVAAGDLAPSDLARMRVEASRAQADTLQARADVSRAQIALAGLLAIEPQAAQLATAGIWPRAEEAASRSMPPGAERRPDVVSAQSAAQAAEHNLALARAQRVRDVTVGVQVERFPGVGGSGNTVGVGVAIPLLWGNDFHGDIARAAADRDVAADRAAKALAAAASDAQRARQDLQAALARDANYRTGLLEAAEQAAHAVEYAYARGATSVMEVMDARRTLLATRLDALQAHADLAKALAARDAAFTAMDGTEQR